MTITPTVKKALFVIIVVLLAAYTSLVVSVSTQGSDLQLDRNAGSVSTENPVTGEHYDLKTIEYVTTIDGQPFLLVRPLDNMDVRFDSSMNKSIVIEHKNIWGGTVRAEAIIGRDIVLLQKR